MYGRDDGEYVDATIHWSGGYTRQHEFIRSVNAYTTLRDFDVLMSRVSELRQQNKTSDEIARCLNDEGFMPPKKHEGFNGRIVEHLLKRAGLIGRERSHDELLGADEWWLTDLARTLQVCHQKLRCWAKSGWINGRQTPIQKNWILWADNDEVARLRRLVAESRPGKTCYSAELTTPKTRA